MYLDDALLYNQGYMISINDLDSPLFYLFDYDSRSFKINMSFQHFHQFYEIHILLSGRASHLIEGDYYTLQPYDIVLLRPSMMHKTEYPAGGDCRRLIINFRVPDDSPALHEMLQSCLQPFGAEVPIYRFTGETRAQAFSHLNEIFTLGKQPMTPLTQQFIHCHFLQFLATVAQHAGESSYESQELSDSITQKVYAVTSYIHRHYASELSLEYLAEKFFHQSVLFVAPVPPGDRVLAHQLHPDHPGAQRPAAVAVHRHENCRYHDELRLYKFFPVQPGVQQVLPYLAVPVPRQRRRNPHHGHSLRERPLPGEHEGVTFSGAAPSPGAGTSFIFPASSVCRNCQNHCTASGRRLHTASRPTGSAVRRRRGPQSGSGGPRHRRPAQPRAWRP